MAKDPLDSIDIDPRAMQLSDRMTFGKYRGRPLIKVIDSDPEYVSWALKKVHFFVISKEATIRHLERLAEMYRDSDEDFDHFDDWDGGDITY